MTLGFALFSAIADVQKHNPYLPTLSDHRVG